MARPSLEALAARQAQAGIEAAIRADAMRAMAAGDPIVRVGGDDACPACSGGTHELPPNGIPKNYQYSFLGNNTTAGATIGAGATVNIPLAQDSRGYINKLGLPSAQAPDAIVNQVSQSKCNFLEGGQLDGSLFAFANQDCYRLRPARHVEEAINLQWNVTNKLGVALILRPMAGGWWKPCK